MKRLVLGLGLLCLFNSMIFAAVKNNNIKTQLILDHIEVIKPQESSGDELYLSIKVSKTDSKSEYIRIPDAPIHWISSKLSHLKQVPLWSGELTSGSSVSIITSLVEEDMPYWNIDDLLGDVRLRIKNENGKLITAWDMPNQATEKNNTLANEPSIKDKNKVKKFDITGDGAHYVLFLTLSSSSQIRK